MEADTLQPCWQGVAPLFIVGKWSSCVASVNTLSSWGYVLRFEVLSNAVFSFIATIWACSVPWFARSTPLLVTSGFKTPRCDSAQGFTVRAYSVKSLWPCPSFIYSLCRHTEASLQLTDKFFFPMPYHVNKSQFISHITTLYIKLHPLWWQYWMPIHCRLKGWHSSTSLL